MFYESSDLLVSNYLFIINPEGVDYLIFVVFEDGVIYLHYFDSDFY